MRYFILSLAILACWAGEDKLPPDAQAAIDKADKAISVIQSKADAEISKVRQDMIKALTKAQEAATKKGDLNAALAIKAKIDEVPRPEVLEPVKPMDPKTYVVGTWRIANGGWTGIWILKDDGKVEESGTVRTGTWKITGKVCTVTWLSGSTENFTLPKDLNVKVTEGTGIAGRLVWEKVE